MQKVKETPEQRGKAVRKYRRQKTMIKKMLELAEIRGQKINMIIYDPALHKIEEIYTHKDFNMDGIHQMILNPRESASIRSRRRYLKFESYDAKLKYKADEDCLDQERQSEDMDDSVSELEPERKQLKLE